MKNRFLRMISSLRIAALAGGLTVAGLTLAIHVVTALRASAADEAASMNLKVDNTPPPREGRMNSYAPIVKRVAPSVVRVDTTAKVRTPRMELPPGFEQLLPFFGQQGGRQQFSPRYGMGSGVIITKDGYILSNNHVVDGADDIKITLEDGRELKAKVVGRDPKTDIAVLKVDGKDLPALDIANSDNLEVGDVVLAVGNPFGIGQTVTMGIISATGRSGMGNEMYEDFIQTDAAINPGNSGGALVDIQGRLIGINAQIISRSGGNEGIGFAVPINLARGVSESLIKNGRVIRGFLGVGMQTLTPALAREFKADQSGGVLVTEVTPGSPAEKAGLKQDDIITALDGKRVHDPSQFRVMVAQKLPGSRVALTLLRNGAKRTLDATLKEREAGDDVAGQTVPEKTDADTLQGVTVTDLDATARGRYRIPAEVKGALVTAVEQDSAAFKEGLREGDVIVEINRQKVADAAEAVRLTEKQTKKTTLLRVWSKGSTRVLAVDETKGE